jgi:hypothetical protein
MKTKTLVLTGIVFVSASGLAAQSVTITQKTIVYTRPKAEEDWRKHFSITWPHVRAASPAVTRKIQNALSYKTVLDVDLNDELQGEGGLEGATFEVEYNKKGLLGVMLYAEGMGAYPASLTRRVLINSRTGNVLGPTDLFTDLPGLIAMVKKKQRIEIAAARVVIKEDPDFGDMIDPFEESAQISPLKLDQMTISEKAITFHHNYEFRHQIKALEPDGDFTYTWVQLRPYIKRGGPLATFAR